MATSSKSSVNGLGAIRRQSGLHLLNRVKYKTDPPGDSFIEGLDSHITRALPNLSQTLPKSTWARGDVIEIQGPAASGKTHLLYFWAMTCILPYSACIRTEDSEKAFGVLLGGRGSSVVVYDCDTRWSMVRLHTIISRYLNERRETAVSYSQPDEDDPMHDEVPTTIPELVMKVLQRVHMFRPTSTLSLAATLRALPAYHKSRMPHESIGMIMIDSISTFHSSDRWTTEQLEKASGLAPTSDVLGSGPQLRELRTDVNPLRHVLNVLLELRRSLGMITFLTNWGINIVEPELPSSVPYFKQHLRAPYPSPFDVESPRGKFPLSHHITIPQQGPPPLDTSTPLEEVINNQDRRYESAEYIRLRAFVRTIARRPEEPSSIVESEFEFAITENGILVS